MGNSSTKVQFTPNTDPLSDSMEVLELHDPRSPTAAFPRTPMVTYHHRSARVEEDKTDQDEDIYLSTECLIKDFAEEVEKDKTVDPPEKNNVEEELTKELKKVDLKDPRENTPAKTIKLTDENTPRSQMTKIPQLKERLIIPSTGIPKPLALNVRSNNFDWTGTPPLIKRFTKTHVPPANTLSASHFEVSFDAKKISKVFDDTNACFLTPPPRKVQELVRKDTPRPFRPKVATAEKV